MCILTHIEGNNKTSWVFYHGYPIRLTTFKEFKDSYGSVNCSTHSIVRTHSSPEIDASHMIDKQNSIPV